MSRPAERTTNRSSSSEGVTTTSASIVPPVRRGSVYSARSGAGVPGSAAGAGGGGGGGVSAEKAMVLQAELVLCRSRLVEESRGRLAAEERASRAEVEAAQLRLHHDHYVACYNVGGLIGSADYLKKELEEVRGMLAVKQTCSVGTDPPHHPVARSAIPFDRLPDVNPNLSCAATTTSALSEGAPSSSPARSRFSPQRYREPTTRREALDAVKEAQEYVNAERRKFNRVPVPNWVVERSELPKVGDQPGLSQLGGGLGGLGGHRQGAVEVALGHFLQELDDKRETHQREVQQKQRNIDELQRRVASVHSDVPQDVAALHALPAKQSLDPAVARIRQKLATLRDDLAQTTQAAQSQKTSFGAAKEQLQAARLSLSSTLPGGGGGGAGGGGGGDGIGAPSRPPQQPPRQPASPPPHTTPEREASSEAKTATLVSSPVEPGSPNPPVTP